MWTTFALLTLACTPLPDLSCPKDYDPVCVNNIEFSSVCHARAAGFHGDCGTNVVPGSCFKSSDDVDFHSCSPHTQVFSELGRCVDRPWKDFVSCTEEKKQGACTDGRDPNSWVIQHCYITCEGS